MDEKVHARKELGRIIEQTLDRVGRTIGWLSVKTMIAPSVLQKMFKGSENPSRREFEDVLSVLEFSKKQLKANYRLLNIFSPSKQIREYRRSRNKPRGSG